MRFPIRGFVKIFSDGKLISSGKNTVVTSGLELLAQRIYGTEGIELPNQIRFGDDGRPTTVDMTDLQGTTKATAPATVSLSGRVLTWQTDFTYTGSTSFDFRELGLFNDSDVMLCRFLTSVLTTLVSGAHIQVLWEITLGD